MALKQEPIIFNRKDENGNTIMQFPITTVDNVEGFSKYAGMPVGFQYFTTNPNVPQGSIPLLGGIYDRVAYKDLWEWVQTQTGYLISESAWQDKANANKGNVPFYSEGDGSTTFRVPSLKCWVKGANGIEEVGSYLEAGLPNITGTTYTSIGWNDDDHNISGAFNSSELGTCTGRDGGKSEYGMTLSFKASDSNSIYGASSTVQPESIVGMWLVHAYGSVGVTGTQEAINMANALDQIEQKMSDYTDNVAYIDSFIVESWVSDDGLSWYRKYSDGWIEQGGDIQGTTKNESRTVTLPTAFSNTNYTIICSLEGTGSTSNDAGSAVIVKDAKTTTAFNVKSTDDTSNYLGTWYACGY